MSTATKSGICSTLLAIRFEAMVLNFKIVKSEITDKFLLYKQGDLNNDNFYF